MSKRLGPTGAASMEVITRRPWKWMDRMPQRGSAG
ncbi:hypothetical protein Aros01_08231 [Streptosporangium roseum]